MPSDMGHTPSNRPTLRLLVTTKCPRNCTGCCNKQWDLEKLPACTNYFGYKQIILTGGEPLYTYTPFQLDVMVKTMRKENPRAEIILYTAEVVKLDTSFPAFCKMFDGITLTLHTQRDAANFMWLNKTYPNVDEVTQHHWVKFRLNVFAGIDLNYEGAKEHFQNKWVVKDNMVWLDPCPLPSNEVFMRWVHENGYWRV